MNAGPVACTYFPTNGIIFSRWPESGGHTFEEISKMLGTEKPLPHFPLAVTIRAKTSVKRSSAQSQNLAGVLFGSDPALKNEYVVVSAHLDHLGIGEAVNGDKIYNGAMDDASGVASAIEIAKAMQTSAAKPKRSILFLVVTAEEKGLLGSEYFASHPTVNRSSRTSIWTCHCRSFH